MTTPTTAPAWMLTEQEIVGAYRTVRYALGMPSIVYERAIADAQARKLAGWLREQAEGYHKLDWSPGPGVAPVLAEMSAHSALNYAADAIDAGLAPTPEGRAQ